MTHLTHWNGRTATLAGCRSLFLLSLISLATMARSETVPLDFATGVIPFIDTYCIDCHASDIQEGEIDLETLHDVGQGPPEDRKTWGLMLKQLKTVEMPPEDEYQPSKEERAAMVAWLTESLGLTDTGAAIEP